MKTSHEYLPLIYFAMKVRVVVNQDGVLYQQCFPIFYPVSAVELPGASRHSFGGENEGEYLLFLNGAKY